ncbi:bacillithiol biosynthesis cysteine-adding enzyme BshC [Halobacillus fulvus]|nr:bacillithiol biosynthesis cysteine-adding enzyme BshC [Halobacillus fulvus]
MRIESIPLEPKQKLFHDYKYSYEKLADKFEYDPNDQQMWSDRLADLNHQTYQREELADILQEMNEEWRAPEATMKEIDALRDEESTVVIAGQQAGLLTGPLYTVNKAISVLQLAKKKREELGKPVIPVFWIAGEDHDFDEINHLMMKKEGRMKKMTIPHHPAKKASVSDLAIDKEKAAKWMESVFASVAETAHTGDLYQQFQRALEESESYSDFFARVLYQLFPEEGLVLVDAHDARIRKLESSYFETIIELNAPIAHGVYAALQKNKQQGYETLLDSEMEDAHLFYHHQGDRVLLIRHEEGFAGKNGEVTLSKEELLTIAKENPDCLSNNVVTRPLMQEFLFPVLAFIGGPGEINYWAALKPAFEQSGLRMPPVIARLSFTYIDRKAERDLHQFYIEPSQAIRQGVRNEKLQWIASKSNPPIEQLGEQVKIEMERIHEPLREKSAELGPDMRGIAERNLHYIQEQIDYLQKRMVRKLEERYDREIDQFDNLELLLHPNGGLQERVWSILPWVNRYGVDLFTRINDHSFSFDQDHYVVYV